ncbi:Cu/Pi carrier [Mucor velutinosus]|uniref:Cu/Pi carrier n=1 Tax=Mucor velutinosus TaxID=708070 RepID=A0AAN7DLK5_9FUNG|nr:Cu/Pi carrier [Mucor velutinosus]
MAFSAKDHKIAEKGGISSNGGSTLDSSHNPGNNIFTYASLFQDIKSQKRTTFNIAPAIDNNASTTGRPLDYNSTFVEAKDDYSLVIDCSQFAGMVFREKPLLTCLRDHYSKGLGIRTRMVGKNHKVIEISFPSQEDCEEALNKELVLQGKIIKVNKTLDKNANVLRVGVSELPYKTEEVLKPLMVETFQKYGDILNLGLSYTKDGNWFTGRGFVTLNRDKLKSYAAELTPQIQFGNFKEKLHLVWSNMNPICQDCHTDDHIKADCPRTKRKACFRCGSLEHLIAGCPLASWNRVKKTNDHNKQGQHRQQENVAQPKPIGRKVDLLDLMNVDPPKYLNHKKGKRKATSLSSKSTSDDEALSKGEVSSADEPESDSDAENVQEHSTNLNDSKDMQMEEEGDSHDGESQGDESQVAESEGRESQAGSLSQEDAPKGHLEEEEDNNSFGDKEYVKSTSEEDSDGESPKVVQDNVSRYNLRHSGHKNSVDEPTEEHPKRSIDELASTPPVEDSEGPSKKQIKQQETNTRDEMVLDGSSTTNTL